MSVVVTGIGAITPFGVGRTAALAGWQAGEHPRRLPDMDLKALLGGKGLRSVDRLGQLTLAACQDALADAGLAAADPARTGVALGTAFGGLSSITGFFEERLREGPRLVTASNFGNIVMNAAASQVALRHGFTALNATLTSGSAAGLDAIGWALDFLAGGRADVVLAGGADELSPEALATLDALGWPAAGWEPAEGAVVWALEHEVAARARGARILARVLGHAAAFDPGQVLGRTPDPAPIRRVVEGLGPVELVAIAAAGPPALLQAIRDALPAGPEVLPIGEATGDLLGAGGPLAGALALSRLQGRTLVLAAGPSGHVSALVLEATP